MLLVKWQTTSPGSWSCEEVKTITSRVRSRVRKSRYQRSINELFIVIHDPGCNLAALTGGCLELLASEYCRFANNATLWCYHFCPCDMSWSLIPASGPFPSSLTLCAMSSHGTSLINLQHSRMSRSVNVRSTVLVPFSTDRLQPFIPLYVFRPGHFSSRLLVLGIASYQDAGHSTLSYNAH